MDSREEQWTSTARVPTENPGRAPSDLYSPSTTGYRVVEKRLLVPQVPLLRLQQGAVKGVRGRSDRVTDVTKGGVNTWLQSKEGKGQSKG